MNIILKFIAIPYLRYGLYHEDVRKLVNHHKYYNKDTIRLSNLISEIKIRPWLLYPCFKFDKDNKQPTQHWKNILMNLNLNNINEHIENIEFMQLINDDLTDTGSTCISGINIKILHDSQTNVTSNMLKEILYVFVDEYGKTMKYKNIDDIQVDKYYYIESYYNLEKTTHKLINEVGNYSFIVGQAGTGKTVEIVKTVFKNDQEERKWFVLSPTAAAADNFVDKITHAYENKELYNNYEYRADFYKDKKQELKDNVMTIHKFMSKLHVKDNQITNNKNDKKEEQSDEGKKILNIKKIIDENYVTLIIDEFGMVSMDLFNELVLTLGKNKSNIDFIFVGDHNQLPPINSRGHIMKSLMDNDNIMPDIRDKIRVLDVIHRTNNNDIIEISKSILQSKKPTTKLIINNNVPRILDNILLDPKQWHVLYLAYSNKTCVDNSYKLRPQCIKYGNKCLVVTKQNIKGKYSYEYYSELTDKIYKENSNGIIYTVGDIVTIKKNVAKSRTNSDDIRIVEQEFINGDRAQISDIKSKEDEYGNVEYVISLDVYSRMDENEYNIWKDNRTEYKYTPVFGNSLANVANIEYLGKDSDDYFEQDDTYRRDNEFLICDLQLAYCSTVHSSQGRGVDNVVIDTTGIKGNDNRWLYTAVTRAKNTVSFIGKNTDLELCITNDPSKTITGLWDERHTRNDYINPIIDIRQVFGVYINYNR